MAGYDRIVAVDENHNLPPETRNALLNSEQFGNAAVQHVTDRTKPPGAAFQTHLQSEVTEGGHATHDALMRIIKDSAEDPGGDIYEAIKALLAAESEEATSVFIPVAQFLPSLPATVLGNVGNLTFFANLKAYLFTTVRNGVNHAGTILPSAWRKYDLKVVFLALAPAAAPNNVTRFSASVNGLSGNIDDSVTTANVLAPIGDALNITEVTILEDVMNTPAPQAFHIYRETAGNRYNNTIQFLGAKLVRSE